MRFDPERWADGARDRRSCSYFPFSAGPYECHGRGLAMKEAVLILATLGQRWAFRPADKTRAAGRWRRGTIAPKGGLRMKPDRAPSLPRPGAACAPVSDLGGSPDGRREPAYRGAFLGGLQQPRPLAAGRPVRRGLRQPRDDSRHAAGSRGPGAAHAAPVDRVPRCAVRDRAPGPGRRHGGLRRDDVGHPRGRALRHTGVGQARRLAPVSPHHRRGRQGDDAPRDPRRPRPDAPDGRASRRRG